MAVGELLHTWFGTQPGCELGDWVKGRSWLARLPLVLVSTWYLLSWFGDPDRYTWFFGLNLGIHEFGHLMTGAFGQFICAAMGSGLQCLVPLIGLGMFLQQRDFSAIGFCLTWLASNLLYVATYMADAQEMALPLVSVGGGEVYHDWNYLLDTMGVLEWSGGLSTMVRLLGYACAIGGVAWGAWVLWVMKKANP